MPIPSLLQRLFQWFSVEEHPFVEVIDLWGCVFLVTREELDQGRLYLRAFHPATQSPVYSNGEPMLIHRNNLRSFDQESPSEIS